MEDSGYDGGHRKGNSPLKGSSRYEGISSHANQSGSQNPSGDSYVEDSSNAILSNNYVAIVIQCMTILRDMGTRGIIKVRII
jgi:hypothetical protein